MTEDKQEDEAINPTTAADQADENDQDDTDNEYPVETWASDPNAGELRNNRWREVIDGLMNGKTITDAYATAYDIDTKLERKYNMAAANGSRLIRNVKFKALWSKVIEERGFNDQTADWALTDLITNPEVEPTVRRAAIKDYNELRGRVIKNVDIKSDGKRIEPKIVSQIMPRDARTEAETAPSDSADQHAGD